MTARRDDAENGSIESDCGRSDDWFEQDRALYVFEFLALRTFVPWDGRGLEINVGTARFVERRSLDAGAHLSLCSGVAAVGGIAEALPLQARPSTSCWSSRRFVSSTRLQPCWPRRVACFARGARSSLGSSIETVRLVASIQYMVHRSESVFYRDAIFCSVAEVDRLLRQAGFTVRTWGQTLTRPRPDTTEIEPLRPGTGRAACVVADAEG